MPGDPVIRLGKLRAIADSADIESQLSNLQGGRPVVSVLLKAREEAADALAALAFADADQPGDVRKLQNEVKRFDDLVRWFRELIDAGLSADREVTVQEREELLDLLSQSPESQRELEELGLVDSTQNDA